MATSIKLSKISKVELRDCWSNEATDFTPWLAEEENLALLADTLGMNELEVKGREEHVGPFRADILCVESGSDRLVLIENQLEKTNHNHLGQILTYAAGLNAVTIIWIAESFTEEHRAAIDWLNRITDSEFNFFGVEIGLIKIGESTAAPMFNVIAKPNDWSKTVRTASSKEVLDSKTPSEIARYEFWTAFSDYMLNNPSKLFRPQSPSYDHWMNIAIGRTNFKICLLLNNREQKITVQLYIENDWEKKNFDILFNYKDEAEKNIGPLDWRRLDGKKSSTINLYKKCIFTDKNNQESLFIWFKENTEKFITFFQPIIRTL